jgi:hypothetical protein
MTTKTLTALAAFSTALGILAYGATTRSAQAANYREAKCRDNGGIPIRTQDLVACIRTDAILWESRP